MRQFKIKFRNEGYFKLLRYLCFEDIGLKYEKIYILLSFRKDFISKKLLSQFGFKPFPN